MRCVVHVSFPPEPFNQAARHGTAGRTLRQILDEIKPEAAYFTTMDGRRGAILVVDLKEPSDMLRLAEPWLLSFNAIIEIQPVMTLQDMEKAGMDAIADRWK